MKKLTLLFLVALVVLSLVGCGADTHRLRVVSNNQIIVFVDEYDELEDVFYGDTFAMEKYEKSGWHLSKRAIHKDTTFITKDGPVDIRLMRYADE